MLQDTKVFGTRRTQRSVVLGLCALGTVLCVPLGLVWWARGGDAVGTAVDAAGWAGLVWLVGLPLGWAVGRVFPLPDRLEVGPSGLVRHYGGGVRRAVAWEEVTGVRLLPGLAGPHSVVRVETAGGVPLEWAFDQPSEVAELVVAGVRPGTPVERG